MYKYKIDFMITICKIYVEKPRLKLGVKLVKIKIKHYIAENEIQIGSMEKNNHKYDKTYDIDQT